MMTIKPDAVYERSELAAAFPDISTPALTRCLLAWGGRRPYAGSRKVFIRGDALLKALEPDTGPPAETPAADPEVPTRRPAGGVMIPRRKVWSGAGDHGPAQSGRDSAPAICERRLSIR